MERRKRSWPALGPPIGEEKAPAAEASPIAQAASSNIASGRISVKSMNSKEKANS